MKKECPTKTNRPKKLQIALCLFFYEKFGKTPLPNVPPPGLWIWNPQTALEGLDLESMPTSGYSVTESKTGLSGGGCVRNGHSPKLGKDAFSLIWGGKSAACVYSMNGVSVQKIALFPQRVLRIGDTFSECRRVFAFEMRKPPSDWQCRQNWRHLKCEQ